MSDATVIVRIADIDRFRLLLWELRTLHDEMRVMASPHADRLERIVDRFTDSADEDDR